MTIGFNNFLDSSQPDLSYIDLDADNETVTGGILDMLGYQGVAFFVAANRGEAANFTIKAQQDTAANMGTAADLEGTSVAFSTAIEADGFAFLDLQKPAERYVRAAVVVPNLTTPCALCVIAIRYGKHINPESNADGELHIAPAEGTA